MAVFDIHVIIENRPGISDPEGDTILNDLILKGGAQDGLQNQNRKDAEIHDRG